MKRILFGVIGIVFLLTPGTMQAQDRLSLEVLPGISFATQNLAGSEIGAGLGAQFNVSYRILPQLAPYLGWDWRRFGADRSLAGPNVDFEETGYAFGLRFEHPLGEAKSAALVFRLGGAYNHIEIENAEGDVIANSGHGLGWEAGAGIAFRAGSRWQITPGFRYRSLERKFNLGNSATPAILRYFAFEVGFSRSF